MPSLYELVLEIERDDIRGGQLLNLLHKRCHCGVSELQTCIQRCVKYTSFNLSINVHGGGKFYSLFLLFVFSRQIEWVNLKCSLVFLMEMRNRMISGMQSNV